MNEVDFNFGGEVKSGKKAVMQLLRVPFQGNNVDFLIARTHLSVEPYFVCVD